MSSITNVTNFEVNGSSGSDTNGGGFDATISGGTDYTQGAGVKTIVFDGSTIYFTAAGIAATVTLVGYTVLTTDVGNMIQTVTSTGVNVGWWTITSVSTGSNTWTFGANITSGAVTGGKGTAGGALASPGMVPGVPSNFNTTFIKGNHTYTLTSSTGSGGKISSGGGGNVCGYNTNRVLYNTDANLPILVPNSNSFTIIAVGQSVMSSLIFQNPNSNTGVTAVNDSGNNGGTYFNIQVTGLNTAVNANANNTRIEYCSAINCTNLNPITCAGGCLIHNCVISGGGGFSSGTGTQMINCLVAGNTGGNWIDFIGSDTAYINCVSYGHTGGSSGTGFASAGNNGTAFINCIVVNGTGTGFTGIATGLTASTYILNCAFYNNVTDIGTLGKTQLIDKITLTADPFTNASGGDFSLNNTAGGGALLRALAFPTTFPGISTNNYEDIGAAQHQAIAGGGPIGSNMHGGFCN